MTSVLRCGFLVSRAAIPRFGVACIRKEEKKRKKNRADARKAKNTCAAQKHPPKSTKTPPKARSTQKNVHGTHAENLPALATYVPTSPSTAKSRTQRRRGGRGGSTIPQPVLFLLRTCANVRFSVQMPPKPAGDLKMPARERANHPRALRARRPQNPPSATKRLLLAADGHKTGGYRKFLVTFSRAPACLPTWRVFHARFFACPLPKDGKNTPKQFSRLREEKKKKGPLQKNNWFCW